MLDGGSTSVLFSIVRMTGENSDFLPRRHGVAGWCNPGSRMFWARTRFSGPFQAVYVGGSGFETWVLASLCTDVKPPFLIVLCVELRLLGAFQAICRSPFMKVRCP